MSAAMPSQSQAKRRNTNCTNRLVNGKLKDRAGVYSCFKQLTINYHHCLPFFQNSNFFLRQLRVLFYFSIKVNVLYSDSSETAVSLSVVQAGMFPRVVVFHLFKAPRLVFCCME